MPVDVVGSARDGHELVGEEDRVVVQVLAQRVLHDRSERAHAARGNGHSVHAARAGRGASDGEALLADDVCIRELILKFEEIRI